MWDPEKAVQAEELSVSSDGQQQQTTILQTPTEDLSLRAETPPFGISRHRSVGETEGGNDVGMEHSVEDQSIKLAQSTSLPPAEPITNDVTIQNTYCQTAKTEKSKIHRQNGGSVFSPCKVDGNMDPGYDPTINPSGGLQAFSCQRCQKQFTSRQGLERHMHASTSCRMQTFKCRHCRKCFNTQFGRRRHERRHDNSNRRGGGLIASPSEGQKQAIVSVQVEEHSTLTFQTATQFPVPDSEGRGDSDESGETKALFACKYCKKIFGTHTNLRRHERRIHERHLLPRGVCRRATGPQGVKEQQSCGVSEASPAANKRNGEGGEQPEEEYMVDISSNISENLSFYIDGKIISTSAVTNCEMMEVNSAAAAVIGLDALIISPAQITQALKIETNDSSLTSDLCGQPTGKRRTSTPPLLPQIKTELESESILTTSPSCSGATLIGTVLPQPLETIVLQKEKTIYLSPKLKQLLQNQDSTKSFALLTEGQKLCPPLPLTLLPAGASRFKRRTASPPSSPQQSNGSEVKKPVIQERVSPAPQVPENETHCSSPVLSFCRKNELESLNPTTTDTSVIQEDLPLDCSTTGTGGRPCNQQPLDLSNAMGKRNNEVLAESVLDLSTTRKNTEADSTGSSDFLPPVKRIKPNSRMLEKVLLNQYAGVDVPAAADTGILTAPVVTNPTVMAVSELNPANPERPVFEFSLGSPSAISTTPQSLNPAVLHTAFPGQLISASCSSTGVSTEVLSSAPISIHNQEVLPLCSPAQPFIPMVPASTVEIPAENSLPAFNVSLSDWLSSIPGGVTQALLPTTSPLGLPSPQFLTDQAVCDLTQRTLVIDSVLPPEAQVFSPSLSVNQSNITSLSFPSNVVVIEYTVALESSEAASILQGNAVQCLSDQTPSELTQPGEIHPLPPPEATTTPESSAPELLQAGTLDPLTEDLALRSSTTTESAENQATTELLSPAPSIPGKAETQEEAANSSDCSVNLTVETQNTSPENSPMSEEQTHLPPLCKRFMCNACDEPFQSMKCLSRHIGEHSDTWPYKCEFCVQLFESDTGLLEHRSSYHGIGKIYVCRICSKEFAFLCNLEQHHRDVHPGQECSHTEVENGKLRPENHNCRVKAEKGTPVCSTKEKSQQPTNPAVKAESDDSENTSEELYTTIKVMASEGVKPKGTDVRLGINQHYPSFKPPPFPYHNRRPVGTAATATNFTTHNIPQTFSTAIRCTKCGKSFDNMPELHKHILACANASDKKRYTPKKNPIPLKQFAKSQNGVLSPARGVNSRQNVSQKVSQPKKLNCHEMPAKVRLSTRSKRKSMWVQRSRPVGRKVSQEELEVCVCPHCSKEFTYHASLKKHMAIGCPMKPVCKRSRKRKSGMALAQENNGSIRTRIADVLMKQRRSHQGHKIFKKTHTSMSGSHSASLPLKVHDGKGKITLHNFRPKRSADGFSTSTGDTGKKSKLVLMEGIQSPLTLNKCAVQGKSQQPCHRFQVMGREMKQRDIDVKPQSRAGEQFSQRVRERTEGPITRSLQQVNTTVSASNRKANTVVLAKHTVQTDSQTTTGFPAVTESKK